MDGRMDTAAFNYKWCAVVVLNHLRFQHEASTSTVDYRAYAEQRGHVLVLA